MKNVLRKIAGIVGLASLVLLVLPSILFLFDELSLDNTKWMMLGATFLWFLSAPFGMSDR